MVTQSGYPLSSQRPPIEKRCFRSQRIDEVVKEITSFIPNKELAWMFEHCFPNTLDTTVTFTDNNECPDTFIITGDISAMWLRDSAAQIWPYLPFVGDDKSLDRLFQGLINRQVSCILLDPYANAFYNGPQESPWKSDKTDMKAGVHERKWELDSLGYFMRLSYGYWEASGYDEVFGSQWQTALETCLDLIEKFMSLDGFSEYRFQRYSELPTETLALSGRGNPFKPCGLVTSAFRPSDDACIFPFLIPSNCLVAVGLQQMGVMNQKLNRPDLAQRCEALSKVISASIYVFGTGEHFDGKKVFFYEVDGFGSRLIMDDANIPSLVSLPYLGFLPNTDSIYQNTRTLLWSEQNPYFFQGKAGQGIGSPHTGWNYIWPMSMIMFALTSHNEDEIHRCLKTIAKSHGGTGFIHESFHKDQDENFTRAWFGWANSLFGELIYMLYCKHPDVLKKI